MPTERFVIFTAGYNCADAAVSCLNSVRRQSYRDYRHIVVDDASTDDTWASIERRGHPHLVAHRNAANRKWLANALEHLHPRDDDIVVLLDLDDWLAGRHVLQTVADTYRRERCWLTYGDYSAASSLPRSPLLRRLRALLRIPDKPARHCRPLPPEILTERAFRQYPFCTSHLITFRGFLWNALRADDLVGWDGQYPAMAWDTAIMFPMLEMCRPGTIRYLPQVLCVYNDLNPLNDKKLDRTLQQKTEAWFRAKPKYPVLQRDSTA